MSELMYASSAHYSMVIQWSDEDHKFIVSFPEWGEYTHTHGDTYEEAVRNGQEVLADLVQLWQEQGRTLPAPRVFATSA